MLTPNSKSTVAQCTINGLLYSRDAKKAVGVRFHRPHDTFPLSSVLPSEVVYCLIQVLLVVLAFLLIEHCGLIQKIYKGNIFFNYFSTMFSTLVLF